MPAKKRGAVTQGAAPAGKRVKAGGAGKARGKGQGDAKAGKKAPQRAGSSDEEEDRYLGLHSDESGSETQDSGSEAVEETADEKRVRLAKTYLKQLQEEALKKKQEESESEDEGAAKDPIAERLRRDALEAAGRVTRNCADKVLARLPAGLCKTTHLKGHRGVVTCVVLSDDEVYAYSGSKDCTIIKWNLKTLSKVVVKGKKAGGSPLAHTKAILCLALSSDGKFLVSAGEDNDIRLWDTSSMQIIHRFKGHKMAITGVCFQKGAYQFYSVSKDRTVKIWNAEQKAYIDTLYGHQSGVIDVSSMRRERIVTCGSDRSVKIWKIPEETLLVFQTEGIMASIDCVQFMDESTFACGAQDGTLAVWTMAKKKPVCMQKHAHGYTVLFPDADEAGGGAAGTEPPADRTIPHWITALGVLQYGDLLATGSADGRLRLWKWTAATKKFEALTEVNMNGCINQIAFSTTGRLMVVALGQEQRLGRWERRKQHKNELCLVELLEQAA